jgi:hypothetical protein
MALSDIAIHKAKPASKEWKLADERGLYLLVTPNASKLWRLKYRFGGKEKKLAIGQYPVSGLKLGAAESMRKNQFMDGKSALKTGTHPVSAPFANPNIRKDKWQSPWFAIPAGDPFATSEAMQSEVLYVGDAVKEIAVCFAF